ncbi:MAG: efflux RND transporter periplasmic adaptor subunit [Acetobacteraceae bacterium]
MAIRLAGLALGFTALSTGTHAAPPIDGQEFDCVIEAQQIVKLASTALGVIASLDVDRGDLVHKGQVLGKLDDRVEMANLALAEAKAVNDHEIIAAQARLKFLTRKYGRAAQLVTTNIVSQSSTDEAESDMKVAAQQLQTAELNQRIAKLEVKQAEAVVQQRIFVSPVDGVVVERLLVPGEYRNDQTPVMTLAQIDPLRVEAFLPTAFYGQVHANAVAEIHPEEPVGGSYRAIVTVVDRVMDAASGTFGVRLALPNPDLKLPAGLKCKLRFGPAPAAG